jgi:hypothetical protein
VPVSLVPSSVPENRTHTEVAGARSALDAAYCQLCAVEDGSLPLREIEQQLRRALEHCYAALGEGGDAERFLHAASQARARTTAALEALQERGSDDRAFAASTRSVAEALAALQSVRFRAGIEPLTLPRETSGEPVAASVGAPRLLDPPRPILRPTLPLPEADEPDEPLPEMPTELPPASAITLQALDALMAKASAASAAADAEPEPDASTDEPAPAPAPAPPELLEALRFGEQARESSVRFARARIALEELGMLAAMRRPDDDDAWTSNRQCERRMLCRLDAIVASDLQRLPELIKLLQDRPLPDPELTLALLFVLGSLRGDDTRDQIARLLSVTELADEDMWVAAADALSLAPHPGIVTLASSWLEDAHDGRRALGVEVLGRKRMLASDALARASSDPALGVVRSAARALGRCEGPVEAAAVYRLMHHEDAVVAKHGLHGAALRGDPRALAHARELTAAGRGEHGQAALLCALCGGPRELELLAKDKSVVGITARGWYGDADVMTELLDVLQSGEEAHKVAAADALQRLTGAGLTDAEPAPDLDGGPEATPFLPGYREPARPRELSLDAQVWRDYVRRHRARPQPAGRYRHGRPFVAAHDLWELTAPDAVRCDRERAYLELRVRFGVTTPLDTLVFVVLQEQALRAIAAELANVRAPQNPWQSRLGR